MGSTSKQPHQKRLSDGQYQRLSRLVDIKVMQLAQQFSQTLSVLTAKVEVLENIALEKGETKETIQERFFDRLDEMNGIKKSPAAAVNGDRVRISFIQWNAGDDTTNLEYESTMLIMGQKQVHERLDDAISGKKQGDEFTTVLPALKEGGPEVYVKGVIKAVYSMMQGETSAAETTGQAQA